MRAALATLLGLLAAAAHGEPDRATPPPARIVNGTLTTGYPAVGILLAGAQFCTAKGDRDRRRCCVDPETR